MIQGMHRLRSDHIDLEDHLFPNEWWDGHQGTCHTEWQQLSPFQETKEREESEAAALAAIGYVCIESAPIASIAIRIEERFSNREEGHNTLVSM